MRLRFDNYTLYDRTMERLLSKEFDVTSNNKSLLIVGSWAAPSKPKSIKERIKAPPSVGSAKKILYKLKMKGFKILYCDEAYTSQRCHRCHNLGLKCLPADNSKISSTANISKKSKNSMNSKKKTSQRQVNSFESIMTLEDTQEIPSSQKNDDIVENNDKDDEKKVSKEIPAKKKRSSLNIIIEGGQRKRKQNMKRIFQNLQTHLHLPRIRRRFQFQASILKNHFFQWKKTLMSVPPILKIRRLLIILIIIIIRRRRRNILEVFNNVKAKNAMEEFIVETCSLQKCKKRMSYGQKISMI